MNWKRQLVLLVLVCLPLGFLGVAYQLHRWQLYLVGAIIGLGIAVFCKDKD